MFELERLGDVVAPDEAETGILVVSKLEEQEASRQRLPMARKRDSLSVFMILGVGRFRGPAMAPFIPPIAEN